MLAIAPIVPTLIVLSCVTACERKAAHPASVVAADPLAGVKRTPADTLADQTYTTRGRLESLPTIDGRQPLVVHHQSIEHFVDEEGVVVGMTEHAMAFPWLSPTLDVGEARPGDLVEIVFEIRWKSKPRVLLTMVRRLPPGTIVELRPVVETGG